MHKFILHGRGAIKGVAEGIAMVSSDTIQGWSGIDDSTGIVIEKDHPFNGMSIKDSILILSGGKGSNGWSVHFHAAKIAGLAPAALVFPKIDTRTGVAAVVLKVPLVTDVEENIFELVKTGDWVKVDGNNGIIEVTPGNRSLNRNSDNK